MNQQILAAWVSAGAAVVQAIGAIGAITVSVRLARDSAERERRAEKAASIRAEEADRRAEARIKASADANIAQAEAERIAAHNSVIDRISALAKAAIDDSNARFESDRASLGRNTGLISGSMATSMVADFRDALPALRLEAIDPDLTIAINRLHRVFSTLAYGGEGWDEYEKSRNAAVARLMSAVQDVVSLRR